MHAVVNNFVSVLMFSGKQIRERLQNWLFCDTPKGADASAVIYSIVETTKANDINVRDYLEYLFTVMPEIDWRNNPEALDGLTPCSPEIRKKFSGAFVISVE